MTERRDSFWAQAGQVIWGICALIGGSVLLVGAIKLLEAAWQPVGPVFWMIVGHALAWGMLLALGCIGIVIAAIPAFSTIKDWATRARWDNTLRVGGALLALVVGLWIVLIAVESSIGLGGEPTSGGWHPGRYEGGGLIDQTPIKKNGQRSYQFEPGDIERARHRDARFTFRVYQRAAKRRERLSGEHLAAFDRALDWAQMGTKGDSRGGLPNTSVLVMNE